MSKLIGSRSHAVAEMVRRIVALREADINALEAWVPGYRQKIWRMEHSDLMPGLDTFLDLMTALRCEVVVVPLGRLGASGWYRLNDFPDNEGNVLQMPEAVKKGHRKRRTGVAKDADCRNKAKEQWEAD